MNNKPVQIYSLSVTFCPLFLYLYYIGVYYFYIFIYVIAVQGRDAGSEGQHNIV